MKAFIYLMAQGFKRFPVKYLWFWRFFALACASKFAVLSTAFLGFMVVGQAVPVISDVSTNVCKFDTVAKNTQTLATRCAAELAEFKNSEPYKNWLTAEKKFRESTTPPPPGVSIQVIDATRERLDDPQILINEGRDLIHNTTDFLVELKRLNQSDDGAKFRVVLIDCKESGEKLKTCMKEYYSIMKESYKTACSVVPEANVDQICTMQFPDEKEIFDLRVTDRSKLISRVPNPKAGAIKPP